MCHVTWYVCDWNVIYNMFKMHNTVSRTSQNSTDLLFSPVFTLGNFFFFIFTTTWGGYISIGVCNEEGSYAVFMKSLHDVLVDVFQMLLENTLFLSSQLKKKNVRVAIYHLCFVWRLKSWGASVWVTISFFTLISYFVLPVILL